MLSVHVGRTLDWTVEVDAMIGVLLTVQSHGQTGNADGNSLIIDCLSGSGRIGALPSARIESDYRFDLFGEKKVVIALSIMAAVISSRIDFYFQQIFGAGFLKAVIWCSA